jgi:cobalt transporter subunit CbtB
MQTEILSSRPLAGAAISLRLDTIAGAVFGALLGGLIIWGVGFSPIQVLHNAAHDARHSAGFPCH